MSDNNTQKLDQLTREVDEVKADVESLKSDVRDLNGGQATLQDSQDKGFRDITELLASHYGDKRDAKVFLSYPRFVGLFILLLLAVIIAAVFIAGGMSNKT